ncbi:hypothetical protein [uncultured Jannaschia sp.]|uniref:hypothetical protein n=1 Tax=uncultured Jannaschia sp. TaxID=293347 RepID=UPI0026185C3F|nr:hypothetical protein [uncultured Jannaschia sp.]
MIESAPPPRMAAHFQTVRRAVGGGTVACPSAVTIRRLRHVQRVASDADGRIDVGRVAERDVALLVAWHDTLTVLLAGLADMLRERGAPPAPDVSVAMAFRSELRDLTQGTGLAAVIADGDRLRSAICAAVEVIRGPADRKMLLLARDAVDEVVHRAQERRCS